MHVNGSRHRRAIVRIREAVRLSETAPIVPQLCGAMAELRRTGDDDALFAELLQNAEEDASVAQGAGDQEQVANEGHVCGGNPLTGETRPPGMSRGRVVNSHATPP